MCKKLYVAKTDRHKKTPDYAGVSINL